ncbi:MAG: hypothetical protein HC880_16995 [Bacteroidia bacterium]|nr:hypothetical protein [Bacteroidia bacterium]
MGIHLPAQVINEFVFNHVGGDVNEFIEIFGSPTTDYSGLRLLVIEGDAGGAAGTIDRVITVGTTNASGLWVSAFFTDLENGSQTLLLVNGFSGNLEDDLDTDDNGTLDVTPWTSILDAVAVNDGGSGDRLYGEPVLNPDFDGSTFAVGGASRIPNGTDTNQPVDWVRNDFEGAGLPNFPSAVASQGEAMNTPGASNQVQSAPANPSLSFTTTSQTVSEGVGTVTVRVTLNNPNANQTTVLVSVDGANTTASNVTDYDFIPATLIFPPNDGDPIDVTLTVLNDEIIESSETITLRLSGATNSATIDEGVHTITITDDDAPTSATVRINEILFNSPDTDTQNEYIELRGDANTAIPANTYLVGIEGDGSSSGDVQTLFNLSGLSFGSNGLLVLLQNNNTYTVDANANTLTSNADGWSGFSFYEADGNAVDIENSSVSFLLIQSNTAPQLADDIDQENDGTPDGTVYSGWTILDGVAVVDLATDAAYAPVIFAQNGAAARPAASIVVDTEGNTAEYVARIASLNGATAEDWVGGRVTGTEPNFSLTAGQVVPAAFSGQALNHIGSANPDIPSPTLAFFCYYFPNCRRKRRNGDDSGKHQQSWR